ncbi:MAG: STAS/SEC14 domain-containing protein [Bacteroidetes bacterium B1(2017)]|nr:MAG: STAS/SEC14 domain-containing protein [Bacteroidetes bacterium B1(2017)]
MAVPPNAKLIEGEIADYYLDEDGILYSYSKNPKRTVELIRNNIALVKKITHNQIVPLLIFLCDSPIPDKATRNYSSEQLPHVYKAMAMVGKPGLTQLIMNVLFKLKQAPIPMKSFSKEADAREWLKQYL